MASYKILIAAALSESALGGPATYVRGISAALRRKGVAVECIHADPRLPFFMRHVSFFMALLRSAGSSRAVFAQDASLSGFPAMLACMLCRCPLIVRIPGDFAWEYARGAGFSSVDIDRFQAMPSHRPVVWALRMIQRIVCRRSARVIVPSEYLKRLVAGWGVESEKITVIPNSSPVPVSASGSREPLRFFSAGRLVPWKNFDVLIRSFAVFRNEFPSAVLRIAGGGPCRQSLEECAEACGVRSAVHFTGTIGSHAMASEYARASCFVLVSGYEGMSHVILEAMAHGLPVIASDAGGNPEIVHDGENGLLVPPRDEGALVAALLRISRDPQAAAPRPGILRPERHSADSQVSSLMRILSEMVL